MNIMQFHTVSRLRKMEHGCRTGNEIQAIEKELGRPEIIAEDLGFLTESVLQMLKESGFPGMKVLQFAFDPSGESVYLPHRYSENCVVYTGTHDNDTTRGWYRTLDKESRDFAKEYMGVSRLDDDTLTWDLCGLQWEVQHNYA